MSPPGGPVVLSRRVDPSAVVALFRLTVARLIRGRRLVVFAFLFALPILVAVLVQSADEHYDPKDAERALIFLLIPGMLVPLTSLIFAAGMIQDEVEEQTLTYLLIRPLPRELIYATKLAATLFVTAALATVFTLATYLVVFRFEMDAIPPDGLLIRAGKAIAATLLALVAYGTLFAAIGARLSRVLFIGVAYIALFESILANIDFVARKFTIMYQFRAMTIGWLDLAPGDWNIRLVDAPTPLWAALNLAIASTLLTILGAVVFAHREYRLKTPEGA